MNNTEKPWEITPKEICAGCSCCKDLRRPPPITPEKCSIVHYKLSGTTAAQKKLWNHLKGFECQECNTPNFKHLVIPVKLWQELEERQ